MNSSMLIYEDSDSEAGKIAQILGCRLGNAKVYSLNEIKKNERYDYVIVVFSSEENESIKRIADQIYKLKDSCNEKLIMIEYGEHSEFEYYFAGIVEGYYSLSSFERIEKLIKSLRKLYFVSEKHLSELELEHLICNFIRSHHTGALATGVNEFVRCTPIEYRYEERQFWIVTEGGMKFRGLNENKNVCLTIFENNIDKNEKIAVQIMGKAEVQKGQSSDGNKDSFLIIITPVTYEFYSSELEKRGYDSRQLLSC